MSEKDYPTEDELKKIETWDSEDPWGLMDFVQSIWWMPDWGISKKRNWLYMSTGGWSGNEDIIRSMMENFLAWGKVWYSTRRGGHYTFLIPPKPRR